MPQSAEVKPGQVIEPSPVKAITPTVANNQQPVWSPKIIDSQPRKDSSLKWILGCCGGCLLVIGLIIAGSMYLLSLVGKDVEEAMTKLCNSTAQTATFQNYLTKEGFAKTSATEIEKLRQSLSGCTKIETSNFSYRDENGFKRMNATGKLKYNDGKSRDIEIQFMKENDMWKILYVKFTN